MLTNPFVEYFSTIPELPEAAFVDLARERVSVREDSLNYDFPRRLEILSFVSFSCPEIDDPSRSGLARAVVYVVTNDVLGDHFA